MGVGGIARFHGERMKKEPHIDKRFEKAVYTGTALTGEEFEGCTFLGCNLTECDLSGCLFADCRLTDCNWSMARLANTNLRNVAFVNCKLVGVDFGGCLPFLFSVSFENCCLDYSRVRKNRLKEMKFRGCSIRDAEFADTDLTGAAFDGCDLANTVFTRATLNQADFRTAHNYAINLELNSARKAKFALPGLPGLLSQYNLVIE